MSTVTKLFVVLHVVLSMLLTAGVVVFVNRVDGYNKIVQDLKVAAKTADDKATAASNAEGVAKEMAIKANADLATQVEQARKDREAAAQALAAVNVQLADATKQVAILQADQSTMTKTVAASTTAQGQLMAQVTELRTTVDDLTKKKLDLDTSVADLTAKNETLEKQRRDLAEKVSLMDDQATRMQAALKDAHIDLAKVIPAPGTAEGAPPINGVINDVRMIEQVPYATISVGAADAVVKGMQFKVIDKDKGEFFGVLTVDSVDTNEATGRLNGPGIDRVHKGLQVQTHL